MNNISSEQPIALPCVCVDMSGFRWLGGDISTFAHFFIFDVETRSVGRHTPEHAQHIDDPAFSLSRGERACPFR